MKKQLMRKTRRGFTLIEIMVVVVIIGLLAAFVGPEIWSMFAQGQDDIAAAKVRDLHGKVKIWMTIKKKGVPQDFTELETPLRKNDDEPFLRVDDDPWGNPYYLKTMGRKKFQVCSAGEDGEEDTEDDICYPEEDDR